MLLLVLLVLLFMLIPLASGHITEALVVPFTGNKLICGTAAPVVGHVDVAVDAAADGGLGDAGVVVVVVVVVVAVDIVLAATAVLPLKVIGSLVDGSAVVAVP